MIPGTATVFDYTKSRYAKKDRMDRKPAKPEIQALRTFFVLQNMVLFGIAAEKAVGIMISAVISIWGNKMKKVKRRSVDPVYSMCVQPSFLIGTSNEDGTDNFAPITWVSVTHEEGDGYLLVISMTGSKMTRRNVMRTGIFSANLVSTDMLPLMDYFGSRHAADGKKNGVPYTSARGEVLDIPVLDESRWVHECEVKKTLETGDSTTFFCRIRNIQMDERLACRDSFDVDLTVLDPVIYSGKYHSIGKLLGSIGDFLPRQDRTEFS